ncbi:MAG: exonuclease SbcCD subunit D [Thermoanaerobacterales bacterium]|nr:exonuclease SbcCD subunit D [Thermoanaerobacterales bacterium]
MKLLHTADWHVGKAVRGRSRAAEHQAVLAEIAAVAERESVDLVVVAGDLFDTASPSPEAERIVYRALLDLAAGGRPVVVVAGNHDSAQRLAAVAPLSEASGIHVAAAIRPPGEGGVLELDVDGEPAQVALLPFPSQRYVVRADLLLAGDAADAHAAYADRVARIVRALTAGFRADTVNLVVGHLMVMGGTLGGGERGAHTVFDYWVPATAFPAAAQYVALGHLHRAQQLPGPAPLHYPGSPLQLDFGETANEPQVNVVALRPGRPAEVRAVPLRSGRRLRTLRGTLAEVLAAAGAEGPAGPEGDGDAGATGDHLRIVLDERARAGLADEVRARLPNAVEVVLAAREAEADGPRRTADADRLRRTPHDLFVEYLATRDVDDERLVALFDELVDELASTPGEVAP